MSLTEQERQGLLTAQEKQLLLALAGRVADTELKKKDQSDLNALESTIQAWAKLLVPVASSKKTLSSDLTLRQQDPALQVLDCNGGNRTVKVPSASSGNKFYIIINSST